jgi:hypothetical protein
MYEYEGTRRVQFTGGATFIPVCPNCSRFVKADSVIHQNGLGELVREPNATCSKCGRVEMPFEGFI